MTTLYYYPDNAVVETLANETILRASLRAGIPHTHVCGGHARCSTCRVMILEGLHACTPRTPREQLMADRLHFEDNIRLACQTVIEDGVVALRRLVIDEEDIELDDQTLPGRDVSSVGTEKQIAILFADIRGFTNFSENLPPYDVIHVLNRYYRQMGQVIDQCGGYIDNYMGDGIMALFGLRPDDPDTAALRAVRAGLAMIERVDQHMKPYLDSIYGRHFDIGVGIHYGEAVVGTLGGRQHQMETAIGDAVNFASRIESANKQTGTRLLISRSTAEAVNGLVTFGQVTAVHVKGKTGEYDLYEVTGLAE